MKETAQAAQKVAKALEQAAVATKPRAPRKTGTTKVDSTVKLSKKELEALQAGSLHGLDERQAKFIDLWLVTQNATQAYTDAGFECTNPNSAAAAASRLLKKVKEHPYTLAKRAELFARTEEIQNRVLDRVYGAAMADPRELAEVVFKGCRFCWGEGFKYQMTPNQFEQRKRRHEEEVKMAKAEKRPAPKFDPLGGIGYDQTRDPNPECPECNGVGDRRLIINDTRHLSPGALGLYGGFKVNKDGDVEIKVADQLPYLTLLGRLYNMSIEPAAPVTAVVTSEQLNTILEEAKAKTDAQRAQMEERRQQLEEMAEDGSDA